MAKVKRFVGIDASKAQLDVTLGANGGDLLNCQR